MSSHSSEEVHFSSAPNLQNPGMALLATHEGLHSRASAAQRSNIVILNLRLSGSVLMTGFRTERYLVIDVTAFDPNK